MMYHLFCDATIIQTKEIFETGIVSNVLDFVEEMGQIVSYKLGIMLYEVFINLNDKLNEIYVMRWENRRSVMDQSAELERRWYWRCSIEEAKERLVLELQRKARGESESDQLYFAKIRIRQIHKDHIHLNLIIPRFQQSPELLLWMEERVNKLGHQLQQLNQLFHPIETRKDN